MRIEQISPNALIIYFGDSIDIDVSKKIRIAYEILKKNSLYIIDIVPSYSSIFIEFDFIKIEFEVLAEKIGGFLENLDTNSLEDENQIINIDLYYGDEVGFDLQNIANDTGLLIDEIIEIHSSKIYDVYAIGFMPGFAFLGNVDQSIATPRLKSPRKKVPKGSVAIADTQTAVYPNESAGGWNIIGRTAMELFNKNIDGLSPFSVGKKVKFNPISKKKFISQGGEI